MYLCGYMFSFLLGVSLGVELLDHMVTLYLTIFGSAFSQSDCTILHYPRQCMRAPVFLCPYQTCSCPFYCSCLSGWKVVFHYPFDLPFPHGWLMVLCICHLLLGHLYIFTEEMSVEILCLFLNWDVCPFNY